MKLIFLYGPPAAGKLTVAKILAEKTNFKLFHNHLTVDLVSSVFQWGSSPFEALNNKIRIDIFKKAAEEGIEGILFTFVFGYPEDLPFVQEVQHEVELRGGSVYFVQLVAHKDELKKRVLHENRKKFEKVSTVDKLERMLNKWNLTTPIPDTKSLIIDNTSLSPQEAANRIITHYKLI